MSRTVCLTASTLYYPMGGGHFWVYLNWALGLRSAGCRVIWLERLNNKKSPADQLPFIIALKEKLLPYGLAGDIALWNWDGSKPVAHSFHCMDVLEAAAESDLLLNQIYEMPAGIINLFKKSALLDIDPGLLQHWVASGDINLAPHNFYFTIGETVGCSDSLFPNLGLEWEYTPPCVALEEWKECPPDYNGAFTTITNWQSDEWVVEQKGFYPNDKRTGFLPFLDLPKYINTPVELAVLLGESEKEEKLMLGNLGWRVRESHEVSSSPEDYKSYIQNSVGEFSCVKPSCIRFQNAWISDRSLCYLASGKPVIIQDTGKSFFLPDASGIFRFRNMEECIRAFEKVSADYQNQCKIARKIAEEFFDAKKVCGKLLERTLN